MSAIAVTPLKIGTLRRLAAAQPFLAGWGLERLKAVEPYCALVEAGTEGRLLELGALDPYAYLLIAGEVRLEEEDGRARVVRAGELDAAFPLAHLRPARYRVTARPGARLIRMEGSRLKRSAERRAPARFLADEAAVAGSWRSHPLVSSVLRHGRAGTLTIPAVPGIALRVRRALAREQADIASVAAIVAADPAIAGRLLRVANSGLFGGRSPCATVQAALVRLGVARTQNLVLTLATRDLFVTRAAHLQERMARCWRHAIDIAALSGVLARLTPGLEGDRGLLVGLLHEIGALPILKLAEAHPELAAQPVVLDEALAALTPEVSAAVLQHWGFDDELRDAARHQDDWLRDHEGAADYTDVLVVAHLHHLVRERAFHRLPRLDETPAFGKLALGRLSPQLSLQVLDEARGHVQALRALLG